MQQTQQSLGRADASGEPEGVHGWLVVAALALAAALFLTLAGRNDGESYVVSLADADTTVVVSLSGAGFSPEEVAADSEETMPPAASPPLPQVAAALLPDVDFLHAIKGRQAGVNVASRALASFIGIASTYNPFRERPDVVAAATASGEAYDSTAWTAAIQIDLRHDFGGVRYGRLYRPTFALVERGDKRAIVRINDVGPLRPGRVIDLNERSMRYFDPTLRLGLVRDVKITLLAGHDWTPGPVEGQQWTQIAGAL